MTTATSLIQSAYREGNLIAVGTTPSTNEAAEALILLNNFILGIFGYEMGENLIDWLAPAPQRTAPVAANYPQMPLVTLDDTTTMMFGSPGSSVWPYPPKNRRIVWGGVTQTVYFPEAPMDGSRMAVVQGSGAGDHGAPGNILTLDGNGRTIEASNTKTYTDPVSPRQWMYRADTADWIAVVALAAGDPCPFPSEFDDFFICALSMRLAPRYGKVTAVETQKMALTTLGRLKARYRQAGITTYGAQNIPVTGQSFLSGWGLYW